MEEILILKAYDMNYESSGLNFIWEMSFTPFSLLHSIIYFNFSFFLISQFISGFLFPFRKNVHKYNCINKHLCDKNYVA